MVLMTMIARLVDGLPLAASMQEDEELGKGIVDYQNQAKKLFRTLNTDSPNQCSIESGPYLFHYLIDQGACFLTLCDRNLNKKLAYSFLEDLSQEFHSQFGDKIHIVNRPYPFIEFDTYIQKAKKNYMDSRGKRHLSSINVELQGVQRIMVQNMDDVLQRGAILSELDSKAQNLSMMSARYKKDTSALNATSWKAIGVGCTIIFVFFIIWYKVY
uniref:Vesicle-trafficking protein SEC22b-B n=1 Tax=Lepeophtheirus salmonis TaxID=72036 RepID=C1BSK9_LEPSM|nr:Vesicle-trafficking protein SEC22b-B [Lepeophtheirus salmonis]